MRRFDLRGIRSHGMLRSLADEDLMDLVARNDANAFEIIVERHADAAFSLAHRILGVRSMSEDVVQEAFLSIWRSGARYDRSRGSVRTWALGIVHHRAIDALRRDGARSFRDISDDDLHERLAAEERTEEQVALRESAAEVSGAMQRLPAEQKRVIELAYFGGFTHSEIAAMMRLPMGTVKGRMRLGMKKLRDDMEGSVSAR